MGTLLIALLLIFLVEAATDFRKATFPCESACAELSSKPCVATGWAIAASISRAVTAHCPIVTYGYLLGPNGSALPSIPAPVRNQTCNIVFLSSDSRLAQDRSMTALDTFGNWTVILVDDLSDFSSLRRATKVPKLSPAYFFPHSEYALYMDSGKLQLIFDPQTIIAKHAASHQNVILTAVRHPYNDGFRQEFISIVKNAVHRPDITDDFHKLMTQVAKYNASSRSADQFAMIDSAILIHNLHHPAARIFLCSWLNQIQDHSDRDQVAFPYVVSLFSRRARGIVNENETEMVPLAVNKSWVYIQLLPAAQYFWFPKNSLRVRGNASFATKDWVPVNVNASITVTLTRNQTNVVH